MYAIIKTGGKQYRVAEGDRFKVETLVANEGDDFQFDDVLMIVDGENTDIGTPMVDGAAVTATIVSHGRHKKIDIIKFRRRKHHQKRTGHRQNYTEIKITSIVASGATKSANDTKADTTQQAAPKAASKKAAAPVKAPKATSKKATTPAKTAVQFLDAPQGDIDDLKHLKGVGPVLEKKLNALGIYHFHQVAAFTTDDIEKVDAVLNFKGRIERDGWVEQAKELAEK